MRQSRFFRRHAYAVLFTLALALLTAFVLLDTYVLPTAISAARTTASAQTQTATTATLPAEATQPAPDTVSSASSVQQSTPEDTEAAEAASAEPVVTENSYSGNGVEIEISTVRVEDTTAYVASVRLANAQSLKTALAQGTFGTNIKQTTSDMASETGAILAVNGDFYGANKRGYVIKNGVLYRDTVRQSEYTEDLVVYSDGSFAVIDETEVSAQELLDSGVVQLFAFGPVLIENGEIAVSAGEEIDRAQGSNPRTAIGIIDTQHYIIVVADGRTEESAGLSLLALAELMQSYGCTTAYNLDGGGSSTMVFNGEVVNQPTTSGTKIAERSVSDIVYISA